MTSTLYSGSLNLSDMNAAAKAGHSAFSKASNGKIYCNVAVWLNDEPDKYGNSMAIQLSSKKEKRETEKKQYIGNAKLFEKEAPKSLEPGDTDEFIDDLPF